MKDLFIKIFIAILKIIYFPIKRLKVQEKVVYISRQFNEETLDFKMIEEKMHQLHPNVKNVVLARRLEKGLSNQIKYFFQMIKQMYHIATSKVVIVDSYCIVVSVLKHKKETKIIQIWHAISAIKKFGYQTIGKTSGADAKLAQLMKMHKNYDYVLCASNTTKKYFKEAFNVKEKNIKFLALPRLDYITQKDEAKEAEIYNTYPELKGKINILYVPTFRKFKKVKINDVIQKIDTKKYNLIVKLHPLDRKNYRYLEKDGVIYDNKFTSYDLLKICDKIVTDYSSLAMEASILNKPLYFYIYDWKIYNEDPGLNFNFKKEEIARYATDSPVKLLKMFQRRYDYGILERFKNKYISTGTENCTEKLVEFIMELMNDEYEKEIEKVCGKLGKEELTV
ncbi:MAG: CDP-glycerol glycerophosphotransferase family protein [Clostridia bacterium]|nr:CDP-glycerol glycerophosphotransferase family protein [Clostridia bacterium]